MTAGHRNPRPRHGHGHPDARPAATRPETSTELGLLGADELYVLDGIDADPGSARSRRSGAFRALLAVVFIGLAGVVGVAVGGGLSTPAATETASPRLIPVVTSAPAAAPVPVDTTTDATVEVSERPAAVRWGSLFEPSPGQAGIAAALAGDDDSSAPDAPSRGATSGSLDGTESASGPSTTIAVAAAARTPEVAPTTAPPTTTAAPPPSTTAAPTTTAPPPPPPTTVALGGSEANTLACIRARESGGNYGIVSAGGTYMGAYQFSQSTWNSTASHAGRPDLVGTPPNLASPADQDALALDLLRWQGLAPWGGYCG